MSSKRPGQQMVQHREDPSVHAVVPSGSKRVVLLSSKSRGSDWELTAINNNKDELQDSNIAGVESEDSGFQVDLTDSTVTLSSKNDQVENMGTPASISDMTVTSQKVKHHNSSWNKSTV